MSLWEVLPPAADSSGSLHRCRGRREWRIKIKKKNVDSVTLEGRFDDALRVGCFYAAQQLTPETDSPCSVLVWERSVFPPKDTCSRMSELQVDVRHAKHQREMDSRRKEQETKAMLEQPVLVSLMGPKDDVIVRATRNDVIIVSPPTGHLSAEERYFISSYVFFKKYFPTNGLANFRDFRWKLEF